MLSVGVAIWGGQWAGQCVGSLGVVNGGVVSDSVVSGCGP